MRTLVQSLLAFTLGCFAAAPCHAEAAQDATLVEMRTIVDRDFYDPAVLVARDWAGLVRRAEGELAAGVDADARADVFQLLLSGTAYCLPDGALMYLAVGTTSIDGEVREGQGVKPDVVVPFDLRHAAGRDAQLEAALERLAKPR